MSITAISRTLDSLQTQAAIVTDSIPVTAADSTARARTSAGENGAPKTTDTMPWLEFLSPPFNEEYVDEGLSPYRSTDNPAEVFGLASALVPARPFTTPEAHPLTGNSVFQGFVLLLAATYVVVLYRHLGDAAMLLHRITRMHMGGDRLSADQGGGGFTRFLNVAGAMGLLFIGVAAVKAGEIAIPTPLWGKLPTMLIPALALVAIIGYLVMVAYQSIVFFLTGALTLAQPITTELMSLKRIYFALMSLIATPALVLFALCPPGTGKVWFYVIVVQLIMTTILYLRESLSLFISKKVSILHWFLYLCAVEIFPISLAWLAAVR